METPDALPDVIAIALDVDIVADLQAGDVERLVAAFTPDYYLDKEATMQAVRTGGSVNAVHIRAAVKVDFFVAGNDLFETERLKCRVGVPLGPSAADVLWVDTAEHAILRKLEWYRRGDEVSDRQWRDVLGIVATQGTALDRQRLETWAERLGVSDLLTRALAQSER